MSTRNKILTMVIVLLAIGISTYLLSQRSFVPSHSLLLYTNYPSPETVTNWIVNTNTKEKRETGKGLAAGGWSPLGYQIFYYTLSPLPTEIWVSDSNGDNLHRVFDGRNYPNLEVKDLDWLTDQIIIVNVFNTKDDHAYIYMLDINTLIFEMQSPGRFIQVSHHGKFWVQSTNQNELVDLHGKITPVPDYISDYYFSPTEDSIAYSCPGQYKFSSLCIASIGMSGITNEHRVAEDVLLNAFGRIWWSQNGKYIGFLVSSNEAKETRLRVIDVTNGTTAYNWPFPTKTTRFFLSPDSSEIIDFNGLLLNMKSGQVSNFFEGINEAIPSYIVDWKMIK